MYALVVMWVVNGNPEVFQSWQMKNELECLGAASKVGERRGYIERLGFRVRCVSLEEYDEANPWPEPNSMPDDQAQRERFKEQLCKVKFDDGFGEWMQGKWCR